MIQKKMSLVVLTLTLIFSDHLVQAQSQDQAQDQPPHSGNMIKLVTQEAYPYQTLKNDTVTGTAVETVRCIFKKISIPVTINLMKDWGKAQKMVKNGQYDGFFSAQITSERNEFATPTAPFYYHTWLWVSMRETQFSAESPESKNAVIGVRSETADLEFLKENGFKKIIQISNRVTFIKLLEKNKINAALLPDIIIYNLIKDLNKDKNLFNFEPGKKNSLVLYLSKRISDKNKNLIDNFNSKIDSCLEKNK